MPKFKLEKLVRDGIVDDQIALGQTPHTRTLSPDEHATALIQKIIEEAKELLAASTAERLGEVRDMKQAFDDYVELLGISPEAVTDAQKAKAKKMGTFAGGIFIESLELAEDDPWTAYYRGDPERFPEIG